MTAEGLFSIIKKIISLRLKVGLTINFDGQGGFKVKLEMGNEATITTFQKYIN